MLSIFKITTFLMMIVFINLVQTRFNEAQLLSKPRKPFQSREELKQYLQKVFKYYGFNIGGQRFSRGFNELSSLYSSDDDLFRFFDINPDQVMAKSELDQRFKFNNYDE